MIRAQPGPRPFAAVGGALFLGLFVDLTWDAIRHGFGPDYGPNVLFLAAVSDWVAVGARWLVGLLVRPQRREDVEDDGDRADGV